MSENRERKTITLRQKLNDFLLKEVGACIFVHPLRVERFNAKTGRYGGEMSEGRIERLLEKKVPFSRPGIEVERVRALLLEMKTYFDDRYDGAPDAGLEWMVEPMEKVEQALSLSRHQEKT